MLKVPASQFAGPNPIENLWSIVQSSIDGMEEANNLEKFEKQLKLF